MATKIASALLLATALLACGDDETNPPGTTSTTTTSTTEGAGGSGGRSTGGGGTGGAGGGEGGGSAGVCPPDTLCFAVKPMTPGGQLSPGRLAVAWTQFDDDAPGQVPVIAYDGTFDPAAERVDVPLALITAPPEEVRLCERSCDADPQCPCVNDLQVGVGLVVVAPDGDASGALEVEELSQNYGVGFVVIGYSEQEHIPTPAALSAMFPEGVTGRLKLREFGRAAIKGSEDNRPRG